jgi:hypothetical protein
MPSAYGGDNFIGVSSLDEAFRRHIVFSHEAVDRSLEKIECNTPRFNRRFVSVAKNPSTALSGLKWNANRSWRSSCAA